MWARAIRVPRRLVGMVVLAVLLCAPDRGAGQVGVDVVQQLDLGVLMPGMTFRVSPADAGHAEVLITVRGRVSVTLQLPAELQGQGGATIPMTYAATDADYQLGTGNIRTFDPRVPLTLNVPPSAGTVRIRFGGTIAVSPQQASGPYGGAVAVQVTLL